MRQRKWMAGAAFAVVMLLAMGGTVQAQVTGVEVSFALQCRQELDGKITITGYTGILKDIVIPGTINGLSVAYIGNGAFRNKELTSVTIPASVTRIEGGAFIGNNNLTSITIGANVESNYAFNDAVFDNAYNNGGKQAGTYTLNINTRTWTKQ